MEYVNFMEYVPGNPIQFPKTFLNAFELLIESLCYYQKVMEIGVAFEFCWKENSWVYLLGFGLKFILHWKANYSSCVSHNLTFLLTKPNKTNLSSASSLGFGTNLSDKSFV